jgi:hypothetical protein
MPVKLFTISKNGYILVFLKQTASGNPEHMWDFYLDPWILKHRLRKFENTVLFGEK